MEYKDNEKSLRLQRLLGEALTPIREKLETLEQEMASIRKAQEELNKKLDNNK
ncbi:hypothetical protein ACFPTR_07270 [Aliibacillus thermotolerans]|uniref:Uncharacterized protein n=1 Tax=Aliibacillus thermotolerans TaxID=1834418 RepID=A0ABW0U8V3_9BACI|nr:hypothetical protein [Aliibacillus thermotolerans]